MADDTAAKPEEKPAAQIPPKERSIHERLDALEAEVEALKKAKA